MDRRDFLKDSLLTYGALAAPAVVGAARGEDLSANSVRKASAGPAWFRETPLLLMENWDSLPIHQCRLGTDFPKAWGDTNRDQEYARAHSEETVRKMKELGVTLAIIPGFKAYGLVAEHDSIEDSKKLAALCHKYGIRVGTYLGSTIAYETFLVEVPQADDWFVPDYQGTPIRYSDPQYFRKRVYFMHPGYRDYIRRVLKILVQDVKADLILFDNTSNQAQRPIFFHPLAIQDFRAFLRNTYSPEILKERLGFSDVSYVLPPMFSKPPSTIEDPLSQLWTEFRCRLLGEYYTEMANYIHGLNPEVAIVCNPHSGISGNNTQWDQGVDYPQLLSSVNAIMSGEEGDNPRVTEDGILVSRIRTDLMLRGLKKSVQTYTAPIPLHLGEAMAYSRHCLVWLGTLPDSVDNVSPQLRKYIAFYHDNFEHYRATESVADVAVLHSFASLAFNNDRPYQSTYLFEQVLIQAKIPFDLIFDENLEDLSKYRVLVLADQECLSDRQLELIRTFVERGGGLVATEYTSLYTPERRRKPAFGLAALSGIPVPHLHSGETAGTSPVAPPVNKLVGQGRVVYIPEIRPSLQKPPGLPMTSQYWKLPLGSEALTNAVKWAVGGKLSLEVDAPPTVTTELVREEQSGKMVLHLLNYDVPRNPCVEAIPVNFRIPDGKTVVRVSWLSPDEDRALELEYQASNQILFFIVPRLENYGFAVIELK